MPTDDSDPRPLHERLAAEAAAAAARRTAEATTRGALDALGSAADGALDAVEKLLFGRVGAAEEVVRQEQIADPVERLRAQYGLGPRGGEAPVAGAAPAGERVDPVEEARRQLAELKRKRSEPPPEVKKTL